MWRDLIEERKLPGAVYWQLRAMGENGPVDLHPPLKIGTAELPLVQNGTYFLVFLDINSKQIGGAQQVEWELPKSTAPVEGPRTESELNAESLDAVYSIEVDRVARRELLQRKIGEHQRQTLDYYDRLMRSVGARGTEEVAAKTAQAEMIMNFLITATERLQKYNAPPPPPEPPPWDRIFAALGPSVSFMYTETVRALQGRSMSGQPPAFGAPPIAPTDQTNIVDILQQASSPEKLVELLSNKERLAAWMVQIGELISKLKSQGSSQASPSAESKSP